MHSTRPAGVKSALEFPLNLWQNYQTMAVEIKHLPKSEMEITGEIPAADFDRAVARSMKEWNQKIELPGFRSGNIPEKMLIEKIGDAAILERAAEIALSEAYPNILNEQKIDAIGHPRVSITKIARNNPLGFKAITAILPDVALPDYKAIAHGIAATTETIAVEEKEVADALEYLKKTHAPRPKASKDVSAGGSAAIPQEADLGGELNDAFAQKLGQPTLDDLKKMLKENIRLDKERAAKDKKRMELLDAVAAKSSIDIPTVLIESEKEKMLQELKGSLDQMGLKWDDYLKHIKKSEDDLVKEWQPEAEKRARFGLVIRAIADTEKLEPTEAELTASVASFTERYPESERGKIDKIKITGYAYGMLRNEKVFE